ncbi:EAL domain-containing protein [Thermithiobacillus tepidarius DSM 3134]|uniref:bifunctional diguanylate cyclase/phosphodiesterase n=1 Tax=Thermithiobacillus tepidarius TaxID=929 RepID=UPI00042766CE|nr:EAL domain-containing protein [Thermithiobacillus tepidarius]
MNSEIPASRLIEGMMALGEGVLIMDLQGRLRFMNRQASQLLGWAPHELIGCDLHQSIHHRKPDGSPAPAANCPAHQAMAAGAPRQNHDDIYVRKDGSFMPVSYTATPLVEDGQVVATIISFHDISERKRARRALQESEARLRTFVDTSPDSIFFKDGAGRWQLVNRAGLALFGLEEMQYQGLTDQEIGGLLPFYRDALAAYAASDEEAWQTASVAEPWRGEQVLPHPEAPARVFDVIKVPLFNEDGSRKGLLAIGRDITARQRREATDALLHEIDQRVLDGQTEEQLLVFACARLAELFAYPLAWIGMKDADGAVHIRAHAGEASEYVDGLEVRWDDTPAGQGPTGCAIRSGKTQHMDARKPAYRLWQGRADRYGFRSSIAVPLRIKRQVLGALNLYSPHPGAFDAATVHQLEDLASRISVALRIAQDQQQLRLQRAAMVSAANAIFITDREGRIQWVNQAFTRLSGYTAAEAVGQTPRLLKSGQQDSAFYRAFWETILAGQVWQGEVTERRKDGERYTVNEIITPLLDEQGKVTHFVAIQEDISARKQAEAHIRHLAHHDGLTGLPNRLLFQDRLQQGIARAKRSEQMLALLFLDLDHFKLINDTLGHHVGDLLLQAVAERLRSCVREGDTVARLGGDEFTVILPDMSQVRDAALVARKILEALSRPFQLGERKVFVTSSVGITFYPEDGQSTDDLLKHADTAMYRAKERGRNNYQFYTPDMNAQTLQRLSLENGLRHALERREFLLFYQPQVELESGRITGVEALLRWQHPEFGLLAPAQFMAVAEESGLIVPIGEWVLHNACAQMQDWRAVGLPALRMAVNLSAHQFKRGNLVALVEETLKATGADPEWLELELTEDLLACSGDEILAALRALRQRGVRISLDDFGSGQASLSCLKHFPVDVLKIDPAFVRNLGTDASDAGIVRAIIDLGHSLGRKILAEGVETEAQLHWLQEYGCDAYQGFFFSQPLPAADFAALMCQRSDWPCVPAP